MLNFLKTKQKIVKFLKYFLFLNDNYQPSKMNKDFGSRGQTHPNEDVTIKKKIMGKNVYKLL